MFYKVCKDEEYWTDYKHGDGKASCMDMSTNWCNNFGDYSIEARRACPVACGLCSAGEWEFKTYLTSPFQTVFMLA